MEIVRLSTTDFDEVIDFLNLVFSMTSEPTDFPRILPKLYQPDELSMRCNLAIRLNGRIRAVVGLFPMDVQIGSQTLHAGGIGGVATHLNERGSGLMRRLMAAALATMQAEGMAFSVLSGTRKRYNYFGYERAGSVLSYTLSKTNARHFFRDQPNTCCRLEQLNQADLAASWLPLMQSWHDAQPFHVCRPKSKYFTILTSWQTVIWVAQDQNGLPMGYLVVSHDSQSVVEILTAEPDQLLPVAATWVLQQPADSIRFIVPAWDFTTMRQFGQICEYWSASADYNVRIMDWPSVLSSLLALKAGQNSLMNGSLLIRIIGSDDSVLLKIHIDDGLINCAKDSEADSADLTLDTAMATRLMLGSLAPNQTLPEYDCLEKGIRQLISNWFPLPFTWPYPDRI